MASVTNSVVNPAVRSILRSPLHSLLDRKLVLISYRGRRSGRGVSLVARYVQFGNQLVVIAEEPSKKKWWRNFQQPIEVEVLLRGRRLRCTAQTFSADVGRVVPRLAAYRHKFPGSMRLRGSGSTKGGTLADEEVAIAARSTVMVVFRLPSRNGRGSRVPRPVSSSPLY